MIGDVIGILLLLIVIVWVFLLLLWMARWWEFLLDPRNDHLDFLP